MGIWSGLVGLVRRRPPAPPFAETKVEYAEREDRFFLPDPNRIPLQGDMIARTFAEMYPEPATVQDVVTLTGLTRSTVKGYCAKLGNGGFLVVADHRGKRVNGRSCFRYRATDSLLAIFDIARNAPASTNPLAVVEAPSPPDPAPLPPPPATLFGNQQLSGRYRRADVAAAVAGFMRQRRGPIAASDIAVAIGRSYDSVQYACNELVLTGYLTKTPKIYPQYSSTPDEQRQHRRGAFGYVPTDLCRALPDAK